MKTPVNRPVTRSQMAQLPPGKYKTGIYPNRRERRRNARNIGKMTRGARPTNNRKLYRTRNGKRITIREFFTQTIEMIKDGSLIRRLIFHRANTKRNNA